MNGPGEELTFLWNCTMNGIRCNDWLTFSHLNYSAARLYLPPSVLLLGIHNFTLQVTSTGFIPGLTSVTYVLVNVIANKIPSLVIVNPNPPYLPVCDPTQIC